MHAPLSPAACGYETYSRAWWWLLMDLPMKPTSSQWSARVTMPHHPGDIVSQTCCFQPMQAKFDWFCMASSEITLHENAGVWGLYNGWLCVVDAGGWRGLSLTAAVRSDGFSFGSCEVRPACTPSTFTARTAQARFVWDQWALPSVVRHLSS